MRHSTDRVAAALAVTVALCASVRSGSAQDVETGPRRAPASVIAPAGGTPADSVVPLGAAPVPEERGPLGEPAPPSVVAATALAAESMGGPLGEESEAAVPAEPESDGLLGDPVEVTPLRSFLPPVRDSRRRDPIEITSGARGLTGAAFLEEQLTHRRVVDAQLDAKFDLKALFAERGLTYPPRDLYFRLFKQEQVLEVWVRDAPGATTYTLLREYPICAVPGRLGPKTRIDDFQAPEGFYYIEGFNPQSEFHLSLRLNYPNAADRINGVEDAWGGDIYIHGGCSTVGCFPMTDEAIAELYWLAVEARAAGQSIIPVHVFPARLDDNVMRWLAHTFERDPRLIAFWENLREGYAYFEANRQLPAISVDASGRYLYAAPQATLSAPLAAPQEPPVSGSSARRRESGPAGAPAEEPGLLGEEVAPAEPPAAGAPASAPPSSEPTSEPTNADSAAAASAPEAGEKEEGPLGAEVPPARNP